MSKVKEFITNLQDKSERTKKVITWVIVTIIGVALLIFWVLRIIYFINRA
jgi:hypothetical protein